MTQPENSEEPDHPMIPRHHNLKERIDAICIRAYESEGRDSKALEEAILSLITADRKAHEEALGVIEQKKKDLECKKNPKFCKCKPL